MRGVIALGLLLIAVALLLGAALAPWAGLAWESGAWLGLWSSLIVLLLCGLPLRRRRAFPPALPSRLHCRLGWFAFMLAVAHVVALALADPLVLRHLRPTLPWYQLAGALGVVLLLASALLAEWAAPRRAFRATHIGLSVLILVLVAVHVIVSGRYAATLERLPQVRAAARALREPAWPDGAPVPLIFPHRKHAAINCVSCHHNFTDRSGVDTCLGCHRSGREDLRHGAEARLHDFCLACHRSRPHGEPHGPVAGCTACHRREG